MCFDTLNKSFCHSYHKQMELCFSFCILRLNSKIGLLFALLICILCRYDLQQRHLDSSLYN